MDSCLAGKANDGSVSSTTRRRLIRSRRRLKAMHDADGNLIYPAGASVDKGSVKTTDRKSVV